MCIVHCNHDNKNNRVNGGTHRDRALCVIVMAKIIKLIARDLLVNESSSATVLFLLLLLLLLLICGPLSCFAFRIGL